MSKWRAFKDILEILWLPFLAFDVFLFFDDTIGDLWFVACLWSVFFAVALIFYLYKQKKMAAAVKLGQIVELMFFSFAVLFYTGNILLLGLFFYILNTSHKFII